MDGSKPELTNHGDKEQVLSEEEVKKTAFELISSFKDALIKGGQFREATAIDFFHSLPQGDQRNVKFKIGDDMYEVVYDPRKHIDLETPSMKARTIGIQYLRITKYDSKESPWTTSRGFSIEIASVLDKDEMPHYSNNIYISFRNMPSGIHRNKPLAVQKAREMLAGLIPQTPQK